MKDFFKTLFEYNYTVNQQLAGAMLDNQGKISEKAIKLFSHILNAHHIWNHRIEKAAPVFSVWQIHSINECQQIDSTNYESTLQILDQYSLDEIISLPRIGGVVLRKSIADLFFHTVNHASYHRGQIATEFRNNGLQPLVADYFLFDKKS